MNDISDSAQPRESNESPPFRIAFFGHDSSESTIRKRVRAFRSAGADITGYMFSRRREGVSRPVDWTNIDLGITEDRHYLRRVDRLRRAFGILWRNRHLLKSADVFYARNIDMLLMARVAKAMARSRAPLVYEALDVHSSDAEPTGIGPILRFVERRLLHTISLLVVSSPMFIERYFKPLQKYAGPWFLLENKVFSEPLPMEPSVRPELPRQQPPWTMAGSASSDAIKVWRCCNGSRRRCPNASRFIFAGRRRSRTELRKRCSTTSLRETRTSCISARIETRTIFPICMAPSI